MKKIFTFVLTGLLVILPLSAEKMDTPNSTLDNTQKLKDIKKLMDITGSGEMGVQVLSNLIESYRKTLPNIPDSFWKSFIQDIDADSLVNIVIPIYDKYLTHDEIKDIIKFYESPSGKKLIKVLPMITQESIEAGKKWGNEITNKLMERLQKEVIEKENSTP
ncbi:MAG: DUF2059 domain-containing protein [Deltaproteobacteria bacterium]|nr:DUF2059 domain-containing protein [Deltaproteobacteria bacterium]